MGTWNDDVKNHNKQHHHEHHLSYMNEPILFSFFWFINFKLAWIKINGWTCYFKHELSKILHFLFHQGFLFFFVKFLPFLLLWFWLRCLWLSLFIQNNCIVWTFLYLETAFFNNFIIHFSLFFLALSNWRNAKWCVNLVFIIHF